SESGAGGKRRPRLLPAQREAGLLRLALLPGPDHGASVSNDDAAHASKSGLLQLLLVGGQALLVGVQLVVSRLFGTAAYVLYMTGLAWLDVLSRAGTAGADKAMLRYIAAHRVAGEPVLEAQGLGTGIRLGALAAGILAVNLVLFTPFIARFEHKPDLALLLP